MHAQHHQNAYEKRNQQAQWNTDNTEIEHLVDIGCFDTAKISAKEQDQQNIGHEQQTKEKGQSSAWIFFSALKELEINPVNHHA